VKREGQQFKLNGQNFNFGGANNYYIPVKSKPMVDDVFDSAKKMGIPVIRTWAFNVIGNPQGN
jgi:endo-1,4-beta-mannosidase